MKNYLVLNLIKYKNKTLGAEVQNLFTKEIERISKKKFLLLKDKLQNAVVTIDGVLRGKNCTLPIKELKEDEILLFQESVNHVTHYIIMYEEKKVIEFNRKTDKVTIFNTNYLPFGLRNKNPLLATDVLEWITNRITNINRTYMNMIYIARKVGRDKEKVIKDSSGVSFTDNFWIKTNDINITWEELKKLRDINTSLSMVALTGKLSNNTSDLNSGVTSLFTTKGYFPKAIIGGYIYKLKKDAYLEYPAYLIGKQLNIDVSKCEIDGEYIKIKIFTDYNHSLVHASELKDYFNTNEEIYNSLLKEGRKDITRQLQRMYIFNYIIGNPDLHDDNYGLIYNSKTFELEKVAPCFDHNVAFQEGFDGLSRTTMGNSASAPLDEWSELFINNHPDIVENLKKIDLSIVKKYLTKRQFTELKERISKVIQWSTE